jgi:hypothetical protein
MVPVAVKSAERLAKSLGIARTKFEPTMPVTRWADEATKRAVISGQMTIWRTHRSTTQTRV